LGILPTDQRDRMLFTSRRVRPCFLIPVIKLHASIIKVRHPMPGLSHKSFVLRVGHRAGAEVKGIEKHLVNRSFSRESGFATHEKFARRDDD
jgi:hypothetical protein